MAFPDARIRTTAAADISNNSSSLLGSLMWVVVTALPVLVAFFAASEATRPLDKIYYNETTFCDSEEIFPSPDSTHTFFGCSTHRYGPEIVLASNCTNYWYTADNTTRFLCKENRIRCGMACMDKETHFYVVPLWFCFAYGVISFITAQVITFGAGEDGARTRP